MPASNAIHSYGAALSYSATSGGTYTPVAEVIELDESFDVPEAKVTNLASPSATHEYIPKLAEPGESAFKCNYTATSWGALTGLAYARSRYYWKITDPNGTSVASFFGFISKIKRSFPDDGPVAIDVTVKRSGPITFSP